MSVKRERRAVRPRFNICRFKYDSRLGERRAFRNLTFDLTIVPCNPICCASAACRDTSARVVARLNVTYSSEVPFSVTREARVSQGPRVTTGRIGRPDLASRVTALKAIK